jgi:hypothetical protein
LPIKQNVLSLLSVLQGFSLPQDAHWVLFRGNSITTRGGAADEEQAKKARATLTGDLLWFQLDGKTFVTQDKDVMDRIQALVTGMDSRLAALTQGVAQLERQLAESRALQAREHELQANLELIDRNLPNSPPATANPQQKELEATRFQMMSRLQVLNAEMQALAARREVELRAMQSELEAMQQRDGLSAARETEILRGAVQEGKAQVVP